MCIFLCCEYVLYDLSIFMSVAKKNYFFDLYGPHCIVKDVDYFFCGFHVLLNIDIKTRGCVMVE